ncbi:hypothetical protein SODALDRAFT_266791 [Sodiomyces alkalinus F11]|uniref:Peptidase S59 domain-containing protein n=1 Tax=Sodiomyces alkalinus (strain CBS 110278 / VKM F-3762 / F11) TaxID=1314773 RepID=A0A3N2Q9L5_SODAK|nr:hypothetical protein SODALDRAFT_266791 [Sodiomyces alkalinus F11]ROT43335.1 hypothetical protein SODALDRAFT_266791 [Sodiomyces alkalinus F11]
MSGFGSTGFGGFGQNNNNQQSSGTGFSGFGANTSGSAFGSTNTPNAFGSNANTGGGGLFGSTTGGGFGSGTTSFGSGNTNTAFGAASNPATTSFGTNTTAGGGLFGANNTAASGSSFGGFGGNTATTNTSSGFGGSGGLFGSSKPFGQTTTTGTGSTSLFGGGNTSTGSFGGFGATNNPGIGGKVGDPPGTNATPFQAHQEKEPTGTGNQSNSFQNILFQDPYKKWSTEELRLTDYNQGRRYGNAGGTGAFGVSNFGNTTGFGTTNQPSSTGFGATPAAGTSLFGGGNNNATTSGFGTGTTSGFGGGGLFGSQNKPATSGGLFASTGTSQPAQTGGLFGGTNSGGSFGGTATTTPGFGATASTAGGGGGGGLFGGSNTQNKPAGFSFGNTGTTGSGFGAGNTTSGFGTTGSNTATGGGLFGNTTSSGTGLFGGGQQQQQQPQPQQQAAGTGGFGGGAFGGQAQQTGSLFGGGQQKPAGGLFGSSTGTSGGLFGSGGGAGTTTTSFGTAGNTGTGGGLFGGQKPAGTGTGLFGSNTAQNTAGSGTGGLFGGAGAGASGQQANTGLFQSSTQNQAKPGGLFGTSQASTGGGLFGSQNAQQQPSFFSTTTNQQPQQPQGGSILSGSLLGTSQNANAPSQQTLTANISDVSAYGTPSLFSNLGANDLPNPGPLATPLSSKSKARRSSILPMYKLNPASASRFVTPQKRGFGFSYSTYGTPTSPSSVSSTPGSMNRSLLGSSLNKGLSKSVSSSSLRKSFSAEDSILTPGAFSASSGSRYYGNTGSMRKLVINKDMRSDLFSTPTKDKPALDQPNGLRKLSKRVSFDTSTTEDGQGDGAGQDAVTPRNSTTAVEEQQAAVPNGPGSAGSGTLVGADETSGKELAVVHEEEATHARQPTHDSFDKAPGEYWMSPTQDAISAMNRMQRQKVASFTVGRDNVGYVCFQVPVDLTNIDLGDIYGVIVVLETRSATVYPNAAKKPPVGKGLNVPAIICLEQSWPRGRDKRPSVDTKRINKHIERLRRIEDTTFIDYNADTGVWKFSVEHFTTYGLDYDEEDTDAEPRGDAHGEQNHASGVSPHGSLGDDSMSDGHDDTFDFQRKRRALPGAFDSRAVGLDDDEEAMGDSTSQGDAFLGFGSAGPKSNALTLSTERDGAIEVDDEYDSPEAGEEEFSSSPERHLGGEQRSESPEGRGGSPVVETPGGILRAKMRAMKSSMAPLQVEVADGEDWMDMLQKTVSPQKRDRALLKSAVDAGVLASSVNGMPKQRETRMVSDGRGFATSIDLMNSLFDKSKATAPTHNAPVSSVGFVQWPYERQKKTFDDLSGLSENDRAFYRSSKPSWGPDGTLVMPATSASSHGREAARGASKTGIMSVSGPVPKEDGSGVALFKFSNESSAKAIDNHMRLTRVSVVDDIPAVSLQPDSLMNLFHDEDVSNSAANAQEKLVWELASILFDDSPSPASGTTPSRRERVSRFWEELVEPATRRSVALAKSTEEKALVSLAGHRIQDACKYLIEGRNFRLATLVSIIGTSEQSKRDMRTQLEEWYGNNVLSEFDDAIRAMYELLAGNGCVCEGKKGVPVADRMESFVISQRFSLNWKQAFGLRLWYVISRQDEVPAAVEQFADDVAQDREGWPQTWYAEQGIEPLWDDEDRGRRQDLLWGLLQLYSNEATVVEAVLRPENFQLSPLDTRLCWQLWQGLLATGKFFTASGTSEAADAATLSFADQLVNEGSWLQATFVLLHLSEPTIRAKAVQDHLARHAGEIGAEDSEAFTTLTQTFQIPSAWIWEARALYMRSVRDDAVAEVQCLLRALSYNAAHETLVRKVAPWAIVSRNYHQLATLLDEFEGHEESVKGWMLGGEIYRSFLGVRRLHEQRKEVPMETLEALVKALPGVREATESSDTVRLAAVSEMGGFVARIMMDTAEPAMRDASRILGLPLTEGSYLQHSLHLSHAYYQGIMAGAR